MEYYSQNTKTIAYSQSPVKASSRGALFSAVTFVGALLVLLGIILFLGFTAIAGDGFSPVWRSLSLAETKIGSILGCLLAAVCVGLLIISYADARVWLLRWRGKMPPTYSSLEDVSLEEKDVFNSYKLRWSQTLELSFVVIILIGSFFFFAILSHCSWATQTILELPSEFGKARIEWFAALGFGIGLIGAIWALLAKGAADKAFEKAEVAASASIQAYRAITTRSLQFDSLIREEILLNHIRQAGTKLRLLIGIPPVGYFQEGCCRHAINIAIEIQRKAQDIKNNNGQVDILYFDQELCERLHRKAGNRNGEFLLAVNRFETQLNSIADSLPRSNEFRALRYAIHLDLEYFDPGLRIAITERVGATGIKEKKAIFWFVSEFVSAGDPAKFKSTAVETEDPAVIDLLNRLLDDYVDKLSPCARSSRVAEPKEPLVLRGSMRDPDLQAQLGSCEADALLYLMLNLPFRCNYKCLKCCNQDDEGEPSPQQKQLSMQDYDRLLDAARKTGIRVVVIAGEGEPLMHPELFRELVKSIRSREMIPYVFTNGSLFDLKHETGDMIDFLAEQHATLIVGMDSLDPDTYSELTRKGDLEKVKANIEKCRTRYRRLIERSNGHRVGALAINMVVNKKNVEEIGKFQEYCGEDIVLVCNHPTRIGLASQNWKRLHGHDDGDTKVEKQLAEMQGKQQPLGTTEDGHWCAYMRNGVSISGDGELIACAYALGTAGRYAPLPEAVTAEDMLKANKRVMQSVSDFYEKDGNGHSRCILRHPRYKEFLAFLDSAKKL